MGGNTPHSCPWGCSINTGSVREMTGRLIAVLVVVLFALNAALLVWMRLLPKESMLIQGVFPEKVDIDKSISASTLTKDMAGSRYAHLYRKQAFANTAAWVVLMLDACFIFAVGVVLCIQRGMKGIVTTEPTAAADGEDAAAEP